MMIGPDVLIAEFGDAAGKAATRGRPCSLRFEQRPAPHDKAGAAARTKGAIYVFAVGSAYGILRTRAARRTVLKVGKVGPGNRRRFSRSHYNPSAPTISTLAQSVLAHPVLWPWLGHRPHRRGDTIGRWMLDNLDRTHFFMPGDLAEVRAALEVYVRARVGSAFEGVSHRREAQSRQRAVWSLWAVEVATHDSAET